MNTQLGRAKVFGSSGRLLVDAIAEFRPVTEAGAMVDSTAASDNCVVIGADTDAEVLLDMSAIHAEYSQKFQ